MIFASQEKNILLIKSKKNIKMQLFKFDIFLINKIYLLSYIFFVQIK